MNWSDDPPWLKRDFDEDDATPTLARHLGHGAVVIVEDRAINFPSERADEKGRCFHSEGRVCIVLKPDSWNRAARPVTVTVAPCSASHVGPAQEYMIAFRRGVANLSKDCVCYVALCQPVPRVAILRVIGQLPDQDLLRVLRSHAALTRRAAAAPVASLPTPKPDTDR